MLDVLSPIFSLHLLWVFPAILVLYFLKLRREEVMVSSVLLWQRTFRDLEANTPFQRLTRNLLLFLQLLAAALLVLAMMRPVLTSGRYESSQIFVLLDTSGSMKTLQRDGSTRFEAAVEEVAEIIDGMSRDDRAMIIAFDQRARALTQLTEDRSALERAIDDLEPTDMGTDILPALQLVKGYVHSDRPPRVFVVSDGGFSTEKITADETVPGVRYVRVGDRHDDMAILAVDALRNLEATRRMQVSVTVGSNLDEAREVAVVFLVDGEVVAVERVEVPGIRADGRPGRAVAVLDGLDRSSGALEVRLESEDALDADDHAYLELRAEAEVDVLVVTAGDVLIERAFASDPRARVESMTPAAYAERHDGERAELPAADVLVFDGWAPGRLDHPAAIFLGAAPPIEGFSLGEEIERPRFLDQVYDHPLTRYINFATVEIATAHELKAPESARVLWETRQTPILVALAEESRRVVVAAITTTDSDWALKAGWPIFIGQSIDWLGGARADSGAEHHDVGAVIPLVFPAGVDVIELTTADGRRRRVPRSPGSEVVFWGDTTQAGFVRVHPVAADDSAGADLDSLLAFEFAAEAESLFVPPRELDVSGQTVVGGAAAAQLPSREIWRAVVLAALAFLLVEWWWYHRKTGVV